MAKEEDNKLLADIQKEAGDIREDNASVSSGLVKPGETPTHPRTQQQDVDNEDSPEPDEEPEEEEGKEDEEEEESPAEEAEEDEGEEEDEPEPAPGKKPQQPARPRNSENALRRIIGKKDKEIERLTSEVQKFTEASTAAERKTAGERVAALANELKLDPAGLQKIFDTFGTIVSEQISSKLPPKEIISDFEERQERQFFEAEWNEPGVQTYLEQAYPNASRAQLEEAKELLDEIAHSSEGGKTVKGKDGKSRLQGYPLTYILGMTHKSEFDRILSNKKRHGLESAGRAALHEEEEGAPDTSSAKGVDALDRKYRNLEASDSGLHRARDRRV